MSVLDINDINTEVSNKIYESDMMRIQTILYDFGCRIASDPSQSFYGDIYRVDKLINITTGNIWNEENTTKFFVGDVQLINDGTDNHIEPIMKKLTIYLEPWYHQGVFTYLRMYVEDDIIILEPTHNHFPILVKDMQLPPKLPNNCQFRIPKDYHGYIKCVDCDIMSVSETFPGCMIISESSIHQTLHI